MTSVNKTPSQVNLVYLLGAGLPLLFAPAFMAELFQTGDLPTYIGRMLGALVLALAAILAYTLQTANGALMARLGLIQTVVGAIYAALIVVDGAPATFWSVVGADIVLGLWMATGSER